MLILTRKLNEDVWIYDPHDLNQIVIVRCLKSNGIMRIGIDAPDHISIMRPETVEKFNPSDYKKICANDRIIATKWN